jgi:hypothetical protein
MRLRRGRPLGEHVLGVAPGAPQDARPAAVRCARAASAASLALALAIALLGGAARAAGSGPGAPQGTEPRGNRADYRIDVRLEGETEEPKRLSGTQEIRWTNRSGEAVPDLWFHLYLNAFSNSRSTHMVEAKGELRGKEMKAGWGWSRVRALRVGMPGDGGVLQDVMPSFRYRRPDDENEHDRTVFSVDLPAPVRSGDTVTIQVEWEAQLPRVRRRTGYKDDFLLVAQWFPKLGVYEAGRGWVCHQFHANTEFYADYGTYEVSLDLPARYRNEVGGSGILDVERQEGGRLYARFLAPSPSDRRRVDAGGKEPLVHDFTWTADPDYEVRNYTFRYAEWAERFQGEVERVQEILGPEVAVSLRDVDVTVLIQPEHVSQADRHFHATSAALFFYGLWFGEYPYQHVTVVDPAWGARGAGGMEYPTLFTSGTRMFTTPDMHVPESVTVHECGHQFFYGLVGNNEFEAAWLDEGFNSYADSEVLARVYGEERGTTSFASVPVDGVRVAAPPGGGPVADALLARKVPLPWMLPDLEPVHESGFLDLWREQPRFTFTPQWTDPRWSDRIGYLREPDIDPVDLPGWRYAHRSSYRTNSYPRPAVALRSLAAVVGDAAFLRGMRHYATTWRYAHPYPEDFFQTFQEGAGVDVQWYFDEIFRGTGTIDWGVEVEQERAPAPVGFFQGEGGEFFERPEPEEEDEEERPWRVDVLLRRDGELALPLPVRLTWADGTTEDLVWERAEQLGSNWKRIERESAEKLVSVVLDPARAYFLDKDMSDNQWYEATDTLAPARWAERVLAQFQRHMHWIMGIGG